MPGFAFPSVGPLGLGSPPSRRLSRPRYYAPRRLPIALLGFLRSSLVPRYLFLQFRFSLVAGVPSPTPGFSLLDRFPLTDLQETHRLSQVPVLPPLAHAPLSDPGGVLYARLVASRTAAFRPLHTVGFPPLLRLRGYPLSTTIHISRLNDTACALVSLSLVLPLPGLHVRFPTALLARL